VLITEPIRVIQQHKKLILFLGSFKMTKTFVKLTLLGIVFSNLLLIGCSSKKVPNLKELKKAEKIEARDFKFDNENNFKISFKEGFVLSKDNTKIFYQVHTPPEVKATFIMVPGFDSHIGRQGFLLDFFLPRGIQFILLDLRGHGNSGGAKNHISDFKEYLEDLDAVMDVAKKYKGEKPLVLLGHSMGGLVSLRYLQERDRTIFAATILSSPFLEVYTPVSGFKSVMAGIASVFAPGYSEKVPLDADLLTRNKEVVKKYLKDPKVGGTATARWYTEITANQDIVEDKANEIDIPLLFLQGGDDQIVNKTKNKEFLEKTGSLDKDYREFDGFYHEVFNEIENEKAFKYLAKWLSKFISGVGTKLDLVKIRERLAKEAEEKAAREKKAAEEKAAREKKEAEEKAAKEKKELERKAKEAKEKAEKEKKEKLRKAKEAKENAKKEKLAKKKSKKLKGSNQKAKKEAKSPVKKKIIKPVKK